MVEIVYALKKLLSEVYNVKSYPSNQFDGNI